MADNESRVSMGKLSELVKRDYDLELKVIRDTGNLWGPGIGAAVGVVFFWGLDFVFGRNWSDRDIGFAIIFIFSSPFINRGWERHKVAAQMRHEREIRVEAKVDALLGLVNIKDEQ
jgi:hypothetical protein